MTGVVYFVSALGDDPIKIGYATNLDVRMSGLQVSNWRRIELLHFIPGTLGTEKKIHRAFARHRIRGEWFEATRPLEHFIAALRGGADLDDALWQAALVEELTAELRQVLHCVRLIRKYRRISRAPDTLPGMREAAFARVRRFRNELRSTPERARQLYGRRHAIVPQERAEIIPLMRRSAASSRRAARA